MVAVNKFSQRYLGNVVPLFFAIFFIGVWFFSITPSVYADAALVGSYDFNSNLNDTLGNTSLTTLPTNDTSGYGTTGWCG